MFGLVPRTVLVWIGYRQNIILKMLHDEFVPECRVSWPNIEKSEASKNRLRLNKENEILYVMFSL